MVRPSALQHSSHMLTRLTRELLQILVVQGSNNIANLDQLQTLLMENLCSKKFLLVMNDVWNDADRQKWDMLCGPLEFGKPGSRILLTIRLDTVVRMVGKTIDVLDCSIKLKDLPEEYLSLFNKCAFGNEELSGHSEPRRNREADSRKTGRLSTSSKDCGKLVDMENPDAEHWRSILTYGNHASS